MKRVEVRWGMVVILVVLETKSEGGLGADDSNGVAGGEKSEFGGQRKDCDSGLFRLHCNT